MNDFSELDITGKEMAVLVLVVFVFMVVVFSAGYCAGRWNVHDNGAGTQPIGQQLEQAGTNISNATSGIGQAENHAGNIGIGAIFHGLSSSQESVFRAAKADVVTTDVDGDFVNSQVQTVGCYRSFQF